MLLVCQFKLLNLDFEYGTVRVTWLHWSLTGYQKKFEFLIAAGNREPAGMRQAGKR